VSKNQVRNDYVATVISIVPFPIEEDKPGIYPGHFEIAAAQNEIPEVLVVGQSVYHIEVDEGRSVTVPCPPNEIARSIVDDYVISNLAISSDASPGIFWETGQFTSTEVITKLSEKLDKAKRMQFNWFRKLVEMADDDWEKTRQHKTISDMQRFAARTLNLNRPWLINIPIQPGKMNTCVACRSTIHPEAVICPNCKMILDIEKYKTMQFAEVK